jgi:hypothetical protein
VAEGGERRLDNGLLPRSDVHTLFDRGYLAADSRHRLLVSPRLREDFGNGDQFYARAGEAFELPNAGRTGRTAASWNGASMKSSRPRRRCPSSRLMCSTPNQTAAAALANSARVLPIAYFICGQSRKAGPTPRRGSGRSAVISDGNRDGNDDNHQRPNATVNSHVLPARPA